MPEHCIASVFKQLKSLRFPGLVGADEPYGAVEVFPVVESNCEPEVDPVNTEKF